MTRKLLTVLLLAVAGPAAATLGGTAASVESDRRALAAARVQVVTQAAYQVHEVDTGGTRVREYVSAGGVVFGVAWDGLARPDLDTLLGAYAPAWREAERLAPREPGRRFRAVSAARLRVETWGHMRHLQGRAWDPALLPAGVTADDLR